MPGPQIYLDNNATSAIDPIVAHAMDQFLREGPANPSSQHSFGRRALRYLEQSKCSLLEFIGATTLGMNAAQVIITSGGTEANNLAIHAASNTDDGLIIVGAMEHPSIVEASQSKLLCRQPVRMLPVTSNGSYDLNRLASWLKDIYSGQDSHRRVVLVSLMLANNETGVINDLPAIVQICNRYEVPVHSDIVQALGKIDFDMRRCGASAVTVAAHKVHGPVGIGALVVSADQKPQPLIVGGGQQLGWRSGTEPVAMVVGLATALEVAKRCRNDGDYQRVADLRDQFESTLLAELPDTVINGDRVNRLPQTSNLSFLGVDRQALHIALDLAGVACSTGSACASGSSLPSATLLAMQAGSQRADSALRFSLSRWTTSEQIQQASATIIRLVNKLRNMPREN
jgi:cysteine desulfurase